MYKVIFDKCDMCEGDILLPLGYRKGKIIVRCNKCGMVFEMHDTKEIHDVRKSLIRNKRRVIM